MLTLRSYLDHNEISSLPVNSFSQISMLFTLDLSYNFITSLPLGVFSSLTQLQQL